MKTKTFLPAESLEPGHYNHGKHHIWTCYSTENCWEQSYTSRHSNPSRKMTTNLVEDDSGKSFRFPCASGAASTRSYVVYTINAINIPQVVETSFTLCVWHKLDGCMMMSTQHTQCESFSRESWEKGEFVQEVLRLCWRLSSYAKVIVHISSPEKDKHGFSRLFWVLSHLSYDFWQRHSQREKKRKEERGNAQKKMEIDCDWLCGIGRATLNDILSLYKWLFPFASLYSFGFSLSCYSCSKTSFRLTMRIIE